MEAVEAMKSCESPETGKGKAVRPAGAKPYPQRHGEIQTSKSNNPGTHVQPYLRGTKDA